MSRIGISRGIVVWSLAIFLAQPAARAQEGKFGEVNFPISCSAAAQTQFNSAVAMLHSFFFPETVKAFTALAQQEPSCAMAYWGIAISQRPNPLVAPFPAELMDKGWQAIEAGRVAATKTQREKDWIEALAVFFKDYDKVDLRTRTLAYEAAMARLAERYPDDTEAAIFYALALNEAVDLNDKTYAKQFKAAAILQAIEAKQPNHPGVPHYIIHSFDFAPICRQGLSAAQRYAELAPAAPHALHMPSHTFSMLGMWRESIAANMQTIAAGKDYAARHNLDGIYPVDPHAYDFMQYAYLQLGEDRKAKELMEEVGTIKKVFSPRLTTDTALAAVPARYMLERQDWRGAAGLVVPALVTAPAAKAITHFARAIGAARAGDFAAAQADIDRLKEFSAALATAGDAYWSRQVDVQILTAQGWLAHGLGRRAEAVKLMRAAADREDNSEKHVAMENRLYPMRELLADLLLEEGDAASALNEYEASMNNAPERVRGFYGAAKAAEAVGDNDKAAAYFRKLIRLARDADGDRAEIREARQFAVVK
jgi:tetratricopeptide (TPR) repeat protein